jgi:hypothetical protein
MKKETIERLNYKKEWSKNYRKTDKYREYLDRTREERKSVRKENQKRPEVREHERLLSVEKRNKFPEKESSRNKLRYAVKIGKIERLPCEVCGKEKAQAHHEDYSKPLEVKWLCDLHHKQIHYKLS